MEEISYLQILSKRQFRCEFAEMRDAGFPCRVFSADDSKNGRVGVFTYWDAFVWVMIETFVDEIATPVAKLIQTACAAGVFGYHVAQEVP